MNQGISNSQGPHQVAQKFNRTTLPRKSDSLTEAPLASFSVKSGAGFRAAGETLATCAAVEPEHELNAITAVTASNARTFRFVKICTKS